MGSVGVTGSWTLEGHYKEPPGHLKQTSLELQDHGNQDRQNHLRDHQNHTYQEPPRHVALLIGVFLVVFLYKSQVPGQR